MTIVARSIDEMLEDIEFESFFYYSTMPIGVVVFGDFEEDRDIINPSGYWISNWDKTDFRSCIKFALENAWLHGTKKQDFQEISIKAFSGKKGIVVRIRDPGEGFDYREIQEKYLRKERFFKKYGYGFRHFNACDSEISFENNGTTINIMYSETH